MRSSSCSAALLALVVLLVACTTVDPNDCWPNTSGGFGGSGSIPIGAGVGVSSGDFISPRSGPLGYGDAPNPCVTPSEPPDEAGGLSTQDVCVAAGKAGIDARYAFCRSALVPPEKKQPCWAHSLLTRAEWIGWCYWNF